MQPRIAPSQKEKIFFATAQRVDSFIWQEQFTYGQGLLIDRGSGRTNQNNAVCLRHERETRAMRYLITTLHALVTCRAVSPLHAGIHCKRPATSQRTPG
jgi:hypothetical protein